MSSWLAIAARSTQCGHLTGSRHCRTGSEFSRGTYGGPSNCPFEAAGRPTRLFQSAKATACTSTLRAWLLIPRTISTAT